MGVKHGATVAALLALAACTQSGTENQAASPNESAGEVTAAEPGTESPRNAAETAPSDNGVSTTMPVPGTNTPEHIVVDNEVGPNELDGL